ncbi:ninein-like protein isoform X2 [Rhea pennata]|uniref:ninein-like protein isoform X2 n=1 Tax=Rhea pennata TaxID=8795 RepID=UPI002E2764D5
MVPGSRIQHAGVASYECKLQCLRIRVRQISRERDKARLDLEEAERRCLQLMGEVDEHFVAHKYSQGKLSTRQVPKDVLPHAYLSHGRSTLPAKLSSPALDIQTEMKAKDLLFQQATNRQAKLEADVQFLQGKEASLQGRLDLTRKENTHLQNKVMEMAEKLAASEKLVLELQKELDFIMKDKLRQVEPHSTEVLNQDERFAEIILEYERQCRVLWDQNDKLKRELERLHCQLHKSKAQAHYQESKAEQALPTEVCRSPSTPFPSSACTEMTLMVEQLQDQLQDLKVQLEAKVNYYKQKIELMKKSFERERKDSEEKFKAEMSKVEEQKRDLEERVSKYWAIIDGLKEQKCVWSPELEERFETERAKVEQQHTKDICHLGQRLAQEGEELTMQSRNRLSLRGEPCQLLEGNSSQESQLRRLQQEPRLEKSSKHEKQLRREKVQDLAEIEELIELSEKSKGEISHLNVQMCQPGSQLCDHKDGQGTSCGPVQQWSQRPQGVEMATGPVQEHCQQQAERWMEMDLLRQQLRASQEKAGRVEEMEAELRQLTQECQALRFATARLRAELEEQQDQLLEAKASLSLAQARHALQLQHAKAQMHNMVPKSQFEQLQTSLRKEQCKAQRLQENLHRQAEQACRQLAGTQEEHERLLQAAAERVEGLEHGLRSTEALLAEKAAQLKDAEAQLSGSNRSKLLIEDLHEANRELTKALQVAELKQKCTEKKNQVLEEQVSALKQLIRKITPASLSG